jgi:hypothetical protein
MAVARGSTTAVVFVASSCSSCETVVASSERQLSLALTATPFC